MKNINEGNGIDIYEERKYFVRHAQAKERQLLTVKEILAITGLTYKKLQEYLYASGRNSWGLTFEYIADKEVQTFHICNE